MQRGIERLVGGFWDVLIGGVSGAVLGGIFLDDFTMIFGGLTGSYLGYHNYRRGL
jgi:hypothetical protein